MSNATLATVNPSVAAYVEEKRTYWVYNENNVLMGSTNAYSSAASAIFWAAEWQRRSPVGLRALDEYNLEASKKAGIIR